jgi:hypothetical protein
MTIGDTVDIAIVDIDVVAVQGWNLQNWMSDCGGHRD